MHAVWRERFIPATSAEAVSPMCLRVDGCHPTYSVKMAMAVRFILWPTAPPNWESARRTAP